MGVFNWLSKQPSRAKNYTEKVIGVDELKENGQYIIDMAKNLSKNSDRRETFENAYARLGLKGDDLQQSYKFYMSRFSLFMFFSGLALVTFLFALFHESWSSLPILSFLAICFSQMFIASFRMMQIRYRELFDVSVWLKNPKEWWIKDLPNRDLSKKLKSSNSKNIKKS